MIKLLNKKLDKSTVKLYEDILGIKINTDNMYIVQAWYNAGTYHIREFPIIMGKTDIEKIIKVYQKVKLGIDQILSNIIYKNPDLKKYTIGKEFISEYYYNDNDELVEEYPQYKIKWTMMISLLLLHYDLDEIKTTCHFALLYKDIVNKLNEYKNNVEQESKKMASMTSEDLKRMRVDTNKKVSEVHSTDVEI